MYSTSSFRRIIKIKERRKIKLKNLSKQQKLKFIKDFSKIKICNLCKDLRN